MKTYRTLIFCGLAASLCLISCEKAVEHGLDTSLPGPVNMTYDEVNSNDTDLSVYWDGTAAVSAGATSFTVELVKDLVGTDVNPPEQIILTDAPINDAAIFSALKKGQKFYVRGRANYTGARYSDWSWIMDGDMPGVVKIGTGIVDESVEVLQKPSATLNWASSRQLAINYSTTAFSDRSVDLNYDFKIELFKDEPLTDLQVALDLPAELHSRTFARMPDYFPGFVFSGLEPATDYWCRVTCYNEDKGNPASDIYKFTTLGDDTIRIGADASASPGDIILRENFDQLCWGGDMVSLCAGISRKDRSSQAGFSSPSGDRTGENAFSLTEVAGDFNYCRYNNEYGLFNSLGKAVRGSTSLADWGQMLEHSGAATGSLCVRPGMVKLGASSKLGILVTPELSSLKGTATVKVTFKACNYNEEATNVFDTPTKAVYVLDETTINPSTSYLDQFYNNTEKQEIQFNMDEDDYEWHEYSITLTDVKPTSRIGIGGTRAVAASGQNRFYLDHFQIEVLSYDE